MIDHVNYQLPVAAVHTEELTEFMALIGLEEIPPNEALDDQYVVRWWQCTITRMRVHIVGAGVDPRSMGMGHLCVQLDQAGWDRCVVSPYVVRYNPASPMRRLWLEGPGELRVEVQHND